MKTKRNMQMPWNLACVTLLGVASVALLCGCQPPATSASGGTPMGAIPGTEAWWAQNARRAEPGPTPPPAAAPIADDGQSSREPAIWSIPVEAGGVGVLSAVWGTGPNDVFNENLAAQVVLDLADTINKVINGLLRVGKRHQVMEVRPPNTSPAEMIGYPDRLNTLRQLLQLS